MATGTLEWVLFLNLLALTVWAVIDVLLALLNLETEDTDTEETDTND